MSDLQAIQSALELLCLRHQSFNTNLQSEASDFIDCKKILAKLLTKHLSNDSILILYFTLPLNRFLNRCHHRHRYRVAEPVAVSI